MGEGGDGRGGVGERGGGGGDSRTGFREISNLP